MKAATLLTPTGRGFLGFQEDRMASSALLIASFLRNTDLSISHFMNSSRDIFTTSFAESSESKGSATTSVHFSPGEVSNSSPLSLRTFNVPSSLASTTSNSAPAILILFGRGLGIPAPCSGSAFGATTFSVSGRGASGSVATGASAADTGCSAGEGVWGSLVTTGGAPTPPGVGGCPSVASVGSAGGAAGDSS